VSDGIGIVTMYSMRAIVGAALIWRFTLQKQGNCVSLRQHASLQTFASMRRDGNAIYRDD
jgi:hypothetical protein